MNKGNEKEKRNKQTKKKINKKKKERKKENMKKKDKRNNSKSRQNLDIFECLSKIFKIILPACRLYFACVLVNIHSNSSDLISF